MLKITVNTSRARQRIRRVQRGLRNLRPFFADEASDVVYREIEQAFDSEGYGTWQPLSPGYAARKRRERPGKGILRYDDNYFRAATSRAAQGSVHQVTGRSLRIGVRSDAFTEQYPARHEEGGGRLPARPVFGLVRPRLRGPIRRAFRAYFAREVLR